MEMNKLNIKNHYQYCQKHFQKIQKPSIKVQLCKGDYYHWKAYIEGPQHTSYNGGFYQIDIIVPQEFPMIPPKMTFQTKIWHPNISSQTGLINLSILEQDWSPALGMYSLILIIQSCLGQCSQDEPLNASAAEQFKNDIYLFEYHAQEWVQMYATPFIKQEKLNMLIEMGFSDEQVQETLSRNGFDAEMTLQTLLNL